ncbi:hypothetical protein VT84_30380 [Gemmata sp. SH-PL17]|uniref:DUF1559 family PulG-like putative transporter n=1 Tax=Gemmata sp. SH-PL17 TaxID=1630693 RepID=UPI0004B7216D|nr:DUF1559 domain-containing protein [Gemmata sp. SH-PL17]AMV28752.1 hypothetical protein VT84_30380 [Gemmata sp. SH-PL17]
MPTDDDDLPRKRPWDNDRHDDEADRPRRRRPGDDEDDHDERPRRRPRAEDVDDYDDDRPRRRPRGDDDDDRPRRSAPQSNGLAIAGLILSVLGFCTCGLAAVPGIICSAIAMSKPVGRGLAVAGLVVGLLGVLVGGSIGVGLMLPAVQKVREAAARQKNSNNMKQIGLALLNQESANGTMSAPYATDNRGQVNRDLSWRVGVLPYIEQDSVYRQFDLSQAWNSPQNQRPANMVIGTYSSPLSAEPGSTKTPYRVFYGGGAMFNEDGKPVRITDVTDGISNTIMAVHAVEEVPWAQPRELLYNPNAPLPQLWANNRPVTQVLMADGSVRMVKKTVSEQTLRNAITRSDGQRLGADW